MTPIETESGIRGFSVTPVDGGDIRDLNGGTLVGADDDGADVLDGVEVPGHDESEPVPLDSDIPRGETMFWSLMRL